MGLLKGVQGMCPEKSADGMSFPTQAPNEGGMNLKPLTIFEVSLISAPLLVCMNKKILAADYGHLPVPIKCLSTPW